MIGVDAVRYSMHILLLGALAGAAAQTCEQCITDPSMQWCYDSPRCLQIGTGCTKSRATCTSKIDCDCSDCSNSFLCGQSWTGSTTAKKYTGQSACTSGESPTPVQTTTEIKRLDDNRASCLLQTNTGSDTAYWAKWTCSDYEGGTLVSQRCNDDECRDCDGFPSTYDVKVIPGQGACLMGDAMDYMLTPPSSGKANFEDAMPVCLRDITAPTPAPTSPAPTPTPALTCSECVAQDNMQWCWDSSFAAAVGAKGAGKCARPGDGTPGCTVGRSTVRACQLVTPTLPSAMRS